MYVVLVCTCGGRGTGEHVGGSRAGSILFWLLRQQHAWGQGRTYLPEEDRDRSKRRALYVLGGKMIILRPISFYSFKI